MRKQHLAALRNVARFNNNIVKNKLEEKQAAASEGDLGKFIRFVWDALEPTKALKWNWHHDAICEHAIAVTDFQIPNLIVAVPPRSLKTEIISTCLLPHIWRSDPAYTFGYATYGRDMALKNASRCRDLVESDLYQRYWGDKFHLLNTDNAKNYFKNNKKGSRTSTSVGGSLTGAGFDLFCFDDLVNAGSLSLLKDNENAIEWWKNSTTTRSKDPSKFGRIVIAQRLLDDDIIGFLLENDPKNWVYLKLPAEYVPRVMVPNPLGFVEPRTKEGELLHPEFLTAAFLEEQKKPTALGPYKYAAQYQQSPMPKEGGIFKKDSLRFYQHLPPASEVIKRVQSWDTAKTKNTGSAYSVCQNWLKTRSGYYLESVYRDRLEFPQLIRAAIRQAHLFEPDVILIEDKANGTELLQLLGSMSDAEWELILNELGLTDRPVLRLLPVKIIAGGTSNKVGMVGNAFYMQGDKILRAEAVSPLFHSGAVWFPDNADWLATLVSELLSFPNSPFKDQVDDMSQALKYMSSTIAKPVCHMEAV